MKISFIVTLPLVMLFKWTFAKNVDDDLSNSDSALKFSEKWLATPKLSVGLILPTKPTFRLHSIVSLAKKMTKNYQNNAYFLATNNITKYKGTKSPQNDLMWLPFEFKHYYLDCQVLTSFSRDRKSKKHILLFTERHRNVNDYFKHCEIDFNSEIVVYYRHTRTKVLPRIRFEEIYKIKQHHRKLSRNILGESSPNSNGINIHGLKTFIWKRRKNLQGVNFNAITELWKPEVVNFTTSKNSVENDVVYPIGYFPDIMKHLMSTLNFSVTTTLPEKRNNFDYLVEMVRKGEYDIGYQGFFWTPFKNDLVDFSYGIVPASFGLYYIKQSTSFRFDVFLESFHVGAWSALVLYALAVIYGYIIIALIFGRRTTELSFLRKVITNFKTATNFVLRLFIGKRISTEPSWLSSRLAFFVLVLSGFFILSLYRAILVAFVAVEIDTPPIKSLNGIIGSNYIVAAKKYTEYDGMFQNSKPETTEYEIQNSNKVIRFSEGVNMYVDKMVNKGASRTILVYDDHYVLFSKHYPCSLLPIRDAYHGNKRSVGMIFKKNWQYTNLFNYYLLAMKEKGLMDKLFHPYLMSTKKSCPDQQRIRHLINKPKPIGINTTVTSYVLVFVGLICALIVLFLERLYP